jgi:hypothetical protein
MPGATQDSGLRSSACSVDYATTNTALDLNLEQATFRPRSRCPSLGGPTCVHLRPWPAPPSGSGRHVVGIPAPSDQASVIDLPDPAESRAMPINDSMTPRSTSRGVETPVVVEASGSGGTCTPDAIRQLLAVMPPYRIRIRRKSRAVSDGLDGSRSGGRANASSPPQPPARPARRLLGTTA